MGSAWSQPTATSSSSPSPLTNETSDGLIRLASAATGSAASTSTTSSALDIISEVLNGLASTTCASTTSPLFDELPPEARNMIHRLVSIDDEWFVEITADDLHSRTAILRTCARIGNEAENLIFENHSQVICGDGGGRPAAKWLRSLGRNVAQVEGPHIFFTTSKRMIDVCNKANRAWDKEDADSAHERARQCRKFCTPEVKSQATFLSVAIWRDRLDVERIEVEDYVEADHGADFLREVTCLRLMRAWFDDLGEDVGDKRRQDPEEAAFWYEDFFHDFI